MGHRVGGLLVTILHPFRDTMMTQHLFEEQALSSERTAPTPGASAWVLRLLKSLAFHDWMIGSYFFVVFFALVFGTGPGRPVCMQRVVLDACLFALGLAVTRGIPHAPGSPANFVSQLAYRLLLFGAVFLPYFQLRDILPAVSSRAVDAQILAFDLRVFHYEPSLAWDRFVNPSTTEWFSFFYFGYFFILFVHVIPFVLGPLKNTNLVGQFTLGIFTVFCTAHTLYMVVPGYGPYAYLASSFHQPLSGGFFWGLVREAVDAGGAQKDIFPSLHTAAPTFFAIFAFRHRKMLPFKYTWPIMAFCASQIIGATMFLRWHYLVDIFAGITLAAFANLVGAKLVPWEIARRERMGVSPVFVPLSLGLMKPAGRTRRAAVDSTSAARP